MEEEASKPDLLSVTSLAYMMVNSATTDRGLEPFNMPTLRYRLMYGRGFDIFITPNMKDKNFVSVCLLILGEVVLSSGMSCAGNS